MVSDTMRRLLRWQTCHVDAYLRAGDTRDDDCLGHDFESLVVNLDAFESWLSR
jgi:hypothetical protein